MFSGEIGKRIKVIREHFNETQQLFAIKLGISRSHVSNLETGKEKPSDTLLFLICARYPINEEWLRSGSGRMLIVNLDEISNDIDNEIEHLINSFNKFYNAAKSLAKKQTYTHIFACLMTILVDDSYFLEIDLQDPKSFEFIKYTDELFTAITEYLYLIKEIARDFKSDDYKKILDRQELFKQKIKIVEENLLKMSLMYFENKDSFH